MAEDARESLEGVEGYHRTPDPARSTCDLSCDLCCPLGDTEVAEDEVGVNCDPGVLQIGLHLAVLHEGDKSVHLILRGVGVLDIGNAYHLVSDYDTTIPEHDVVFDGLLDYHRNKADQARRIASLVNSLVTHELYHILPPVF